MITRYLIFILFITLSNGITCQDIHFSQFNLAPLNLNPAMTGSFNGDYRFVGNLRNQWSSVTVPYKTFAFSVEKNKVYKTPFSAGIQINQDNAGDSRFNTFQLNFSGSYKYELKDSSHFIIGGTQIGITNRHLDFNPLSFDVQYNGVQYDPTLPNQENFSTNNRTYANLNFGIAHQYIKNEKLSIYSGFSLFNLNSAKQSYYNDNNIRLDPRFVLHSKGKWKAADKINLLPGFQWMKQGKHQELIVSMETEYVLIDFMNTYKSIWAGISYRNNDAAYLTTGMNYDSWKIGLSYDLNISKLIPASLFRGGFEIAIIYIIDRTPIEKVIHRICPDYI